MNTKEMNLVAALKLGLINWFQYFELLRDVPVEARIERKVA